MATVTIIPPPRRNDLIVRPLGDDGQQVVKDPRTGSYFNLGAQEAFLLEQLDGTRTAEQICDAFKQTFGEELTHEELDDFLGLARSQDLLLRWPAAEGRVGSDFGSPKTS